MVFSRSSRAGYEQFENRSSHPVYNLITRITLCCLAFSFCMIIFLYVFAYCCGDYVVKDLPDSFSKQGGFQLKHGVLAFSENEAFEKIPNADGIAYENFSQLNDDKCSLRTENEKFDCYPEDGATEESCTARGCCWQRQSDEKDIFPPLNVPYCYYPKSYGGYQYINVTYSKNGLRAFLQRTFASPYPNDVKLLRMDVQYQSSDIVRVKIIDAVNDRYQTPLPEVPIGPSDPPRDPTYKIIISESETGFQLARNDNTVIFDAKNKGGFIYADQFLQISAAFEGKIYGIGEHQSRLALNTSWTRFTLFNHDSIPVDDTNLYGSHPFYLVLEPSGSSHGVFFLNSNAMDVLLQPLPAITFRSIGGIFDFYFFLGPKPADVVRQYTEIIGRPFLPPYWSLGFHLSRFGYQNTEHLRAVWERTRKAGIPFDTQWTDIDYMDKNNDFTYDKKNYKNLPEFVKEIHDAGMRYIPILDPGISGCESAGSYAPYDNGISSDVFVKSADGRVFVGKVWNSKCTVFPDFTNPKTLDYWMTFIKKLHKSIPFDGLWIDMNEPSNFLDGSVNGCPNNSYEYPPYLPGVDGGKLFYKTLCMSAKQYAGLHYDVHNLYGISEALATNRALKEITQKRPFIISRSTFPGIGRFAGHWSGDVISTWHHMKLSIPQLLSFSLFGVPMMGADICGFNGNTTALLCQRWSQLGAFYPFSRNHNTDSAIDQDPVALGKDVVASTVRALTVRYTLLPYLYTLFWKAHVFGDTVARPLFFEFGDDNNTHAIDESFLWGCCVLIVPVLEEYATTVSTYLPAARWYDWYTGLGKGSDGTKVVLPAPPDTIPVLIRGGVVLPIQEPNVTTSLSRLNKITLIGAYDTSLSAFGSLYWDDGESLLTGDEKEYGLVNFTLTAAKFSSQIVNWNYPSVPQLGTIKIWGFVKPIQNVTFNDNKVAFEYDAISLVLTVENLNLDINKSFVLSWS